MFVVAIAIALCLAISSVLARVLTAVYTRKFSVKVFVGIIPGCILSLFLMVVLLPFGCSWTDSYELRHLEENARKAVTGDELQAWATNVLAHPDDGMLQANYPSPLRRIRPIQSPQVWVCTNPDDPPFVTLHWEAPEVLAEFQIGPTNFVGMGHKWQDGVYFLWQRR